jgi:hypothetical protein
MVKNCRVKICQIFLSYHLSGISHSPLAAPQKKSLGKMTLYHATSREAGSSIVNGGYIFGGGGGK